jgi:hypothetical protein
MCGELDDTVQINAEIENRLTIIARHVGVDLPSTIGTPGPLAEDAARAAYMERVFKEGLTACLMDVGGAAEDEKIDAIAARAIAFARLAGFLAGQLPPEADLFRSTVEALTEGHTEPRRIAGRLCAAMEDHHHHDDETHGHSHGNSHAHGHSHGHSHGPNHASDHTHD